MSDIALSPRKRRRVHMMMWAILMHRLDPDLSWLYLLRWAELGGTARRT
jgi:hypothetical protein